MFLFKMIISGNILPKWLGLQRWNLVLVIIDTLKYTIIVRYAYQKQYLNVLNC